MKTTITATWVLVLGLGLLMPLSGVASDQGGNKPEKSAVEMQKKGSSTDLNSNVQKEEKRNSQIKFKGGDAIIPANMPIYRPPLRGAPAGRVAGGTRGVGEEFPYLCLLVPEHVGLTAHEQPCLFYFLSKPTSYSMEFTLIEKHAVYPLIEIPIRSVRKSGVHSICLADYGSHLEPGKQYRWFVALVPDSQNRSKDVLAAGAIELVDLPGGLKTKLQESGMTPSQHFPPLSERTPGIPD